MNKLEFTIGTDPEFFISDINDSEKLLKANKFTTGTKDKLEDLENGYSCHADNVMLELNIPPALNLESFISNINKGKSLLKEKILKNKANLLVVPSVEFPNSELTEEQDYEIGCEADVDAYTCEENPTVSLPDGKRYAGGHIHVGFVKLPSPEDMIKMIKAIDFCMMPLIIKHDSFSDRKLVYGTPGRFRAKPYGFEYRSTSNFWLKSEELITEVYNVISHAINNFERYSEDEYRIQLIKDSFQSTLDINCSKMDLEMVEMELKN